jgi:hypothetical protein
VTDPLDDYCQPDHHCPNALLLWQQVEDARQAWLDDAADHQSETYRTLRHRERTYREHRMNCEQIKPEKHHCDSSLTMPTCSLCGSRR